MTRWSPKPFTLRQLQYALAVADHRSFRKAAEECAVSQPALSEQIGQLESTLGILLFERLPAGIVVTSGGAAVLERVRQTLLDADDVTEAAGRARDPLSGPLRIGVIPTVAPYVLPEAAPVLRRKYPGLRLVWVEEKTRVLVDRVSAGDLEAAIVALESGLGDLATEPLGRDPFLLALPRGHRLAGDKAPARLDDLDGETVLLLEDGHCFRDQALSVCRRAGAEEASVRATSLSTLAQMVAGGTGITLLPRLAVGAENRAGALVVRAFGVRGPARTLVLAFRRTSPRATAARALAETLRAVVGKLEGP